MTNITLPRSVVEQALDALEVMLSWQSLAPIIEQKNAKTQAADLRAALAAPPAKCPHGLFDVCCESPGACSLGAAPQGEPALRRMPCQITMDTCSSQPDEAPRCQTCGHWTSTPCKDGGIYPTGSLAKPQPAPTLEPPQGLKLVPVEPNEAMQYAGGAAIGGMPSDLEDADRAYRAMLAAAPQFDAAKLKGGAA